jgi:dienelactone hydrolase
MELNILWNLRLMIKTYHCLNKKRYNNFMKNILSFIFFIVLGCSQGYAQQVGHATVTFVDSLRNNRQIITEVYYPSNVAGNNTPIAPGAFPLISFGHGFVMTWSAYQNFWDMLVLEGYIVAFPTTESGIAPIHTEFGKDLKFLISEIQTNGAGTVFSASSVGTTSAIMGHSMGGGSSFLAAENNTTITTMVTFAAANTNPSSITAAQHVSVPTLLFSGVNDCVTPPAQHQDIMYDSTIVAFKTQINILGGGHCYFANSNFSCTFGESTCTPSPTIVREEQQDVTSDFLKLWLGYFLKNDCQNAQAFQDSLLTSTRINYRQNQSIACVTRIKLINSENKSTVFPNPFSTQLTLELEKEPIKEIRIYNVMMQQVTLYLFETMNSIETVDFTALESGVYFMKINNNHWQKIVKSHP